MKKGSSAASLEVDGAAEAGGIAEIKNNMTLFDIARLTESRSDKSVNSVEVSSKNEAAESDPVAEEDTTVETPRSNGESLRQRTSSVVWVEIHQNEKKKSRFRQEMYTWGVALFASLLLSLFAISNTLLTFRAASIDFRSAMNIILNRAFYEIGVFVALQRYSWSRTGDVAEGFWFIVAGTLFEVCMYVGAYFCDYFTSKTPVQVCFVIWPIFAIRMVAIFAISPPNGKESMKQYSLIARFALTVVMAVIVTLSILLPCGSILIYRYATTSLAQKSLVASSAITGVLYPILAVLVRYSVENVVVPYFYHFAEQEDITFVLDSYGAICRVIKLSLSLPSMTAMYYVYGVSDEKKSKRVLFFFISQMFGLAIEIAVHYGKLLKITNPTARSLAQALSPVRLAGCCKEDQAKSRRQREVSVEITLNELVTFDASNVGRDDSTADTQALSQEQELELKFLAVRVVNDNYAEHVAAIASPILSTCFIKRGNIFTASSTTWSTIWGIAPMAVAIELIADAAVYKLCERYYCHTKNVLLRPRFPDIVVTVSMAACVFGIMLSTDLQFISM